MKIGFIGVGEMAKAILSGLIRKKSENIADFYITSRTESSAKEKASTYAINYIIGNPDLVKKTDVIFLGVKPTDVEKVLCEIKPYLKQDKILITMAAGLKIDYYEKILGEDVKLIRIMPNTPVNVNEGAIALCSNKNVKDEDTKRVYDLLKNIGEVELVDENLFDVVGAVSGSGPVYAYMLVSAIMSAAEENGMEYEQSKLLITQTIKGAAELLLASGESPDKLIEQVCSPGGSTIEAVNLMKSNKFEKIVKDGINAAIKKNKQMGEK